MPSSAWSSDVCSSDRSEEHTSELQSLTNLVCRLLLGTEKHTSELQSLTNLVCRLLLEIKKLKVITPVIFMCGFLYSVLSVLSPCILRLTYILRSDEGL